VLVAKIPARIRHKMPLNFKMLLELERPTPNFSRGESSIFLRLKMDILSWTRPEFAVFGINFSLKFDFHSSSSTGLILQYF
jgi:hypothetical protein